MATPTTTSNRRGSRQFPPEYLDIWRLAVSPVGLRLEFPSHGQATNMRHRLNTYRKRLMEEAPELAAPFMLADLNIRSEGDIFVLEDHVPDWKRQLRAQLGGISAEAPAPANPPGALDSTLSGLGFTSEDDTKNPPIVDIKTGPLP